MKIILRKTSLILSLFGLVPSLAIAASQWTECVTIAGVSNYLATNNSIYLSVKPAIPGCSGGSTGILSGLTFAIDQQGVTQSNINGFYAAALAAQLTEKKVMIYFDNSSSDCFGKILSSGGFSGQCN